MHQYSLSKKFNKDRQSLFNSCIDALKFCKFHIQNTDTKNFTISANVSLSFWSWGEKIYVEVKDDSTVFIRSKLALPLQIFDWGKNKRNVYNFFRNLESILNR